MVVADAAVGNPIQQGQIDARQKHNVIAALPTSRERRDSTGVDISVRNRRSIMRHRLHFTALVAMSLIGAADQALAQQGAGAAAGAAPGITTTPPVGAQNPGSAGISSAPGGASTTTTGMGTGVGLGTNLNARGFNQPGAPNTSTPGTTGRAGASPSGLPGDDPYHPGFPGRVGQ
jgi:hypothetical protein